MQRAVLVALALLLFVGCGDQGPKIPQFNGHWQGELDFWPLDFVVTENNQQIAGTVTFQAIGDRDSVVYSVDGVHTHPDVSLILRRSGYSDMNYTARFHNDDEIRGAVDGGGYTGQTLILFRAN
jgi:hypothetical protein